MKIIKKLSEYIAEELADAEKYIDCANKYKLDMPELAKAFYDRSNEEMQHAMIWHEWAEKLIEQERARLKAANEQVPERMIIYYEIEHEKYINKYNEVRIKQEVFKKSY